MEPLTPAQMPGRPGVVTAASVVMIVIGALVSLFGLIAALVGSQWQSFIRNPQVVDQIGVLPDSAGRILVLGGLILVTIGVLELVSGIYVLMARGWARILGLVLASIGSLFWALSVVSVTARSAVVPLVLLGASAFVIWALAGNGAYFNRRGESINR